MKAFLRSLGVHVSFVRGQVIMPSFWFAISSSAYPNIREKEEEKE